MVKTFMCGSDSISREDFIESMRVAISKSRQIGRTIFYYPCLLGECEGKWGVIPCDHVLSYFNQIIQEEKVGTTQRNVILVGTNHNEGLMYRAMMSVADAVFMNGGAGECRKKKIRKVGSKFGNIGFNSNPRLSLTLPRYQAPAFRSEERKDRKRLMRREKRSRIETRGWA